MTQNNTINTNFFFVKVHFFEIKMINFLYKSWQLTKNNHDENIKNDEQELCYKRWIG